ncbi:Type IV fimbrial biogenesis protein PilY1 [Labilithrix luteola]|uniref:Type IV fimbrial biogenesis protein PilY1 n=1 Tax=Labilithrix luteola TaxID=1391654 RepID=A0A0K1PZE6_9BACT|nr:hypothetical protein [Labilithrix luteola]AKU98867.1 Type IV fimbrial biogenesis protein PilY1 [Labilithrix luteola]
MKTIRRTWMARGIALTTLTSLGGLIAAFASCATTENASESALRPDATILEEASTPPKEEVDSGDEENPLVDAGDCDAADPTCNTHVVTCDEVEWCGVDSKVNPLYILKAVWGSSKNDVWAVGSGGAVTHYDGSQWSLVPTGVKNTFLTVWGSGPNDVYTLSDSETVLHTTGYSTSGTTWTSMPTPAAGAYKCPAYAIYGTSASDVRIGARSHNLPNMGSYSGDMFLRKDLDDGGVGWQSVAGAAFYVRGFWASSPSDYWMIADNSTGATQYERAKIMHGVPNPNPPDASVDAGFVDPLVWTPIDSQANVVLDAIWGSSASDVWVVGGAGTVRHKTPSDGRWVPIAVPTTLNLHGVWGSGPNDIWFIGDAGTILHYDGTSFRSVSAQFPIGRKPNLYGIWGSSANDVWIVGDAITLHYTGPKVGAQGGGR